MTEGFAQLTVAGRDDGTGDGGYGFADYCAEGKGPDDQNYCGRMQYLGIMKGVPCGRAVCEVKREIPDDESIRKDR